MSSLKSKTETNQVEPDDILVKSDCWRMERAGPYTNLGGRLGVAAAGTAKCIDSPKDARTCCDRCCRHQVGARHLFPQNLVGRALASDWRCKANHFGLLDEQPRSECSGRDGQYDRPPGWATGREMSEAR
jgi:hypothetical protein